MDIYIYIYIYIKIDRRMIRKVYIYVPIMYIYTNTYIYVYSDSSSRMSSGVVMGINNSAVCKQVLAAFLVLLDRQPLASLIFNYQPPFSVGIRPPHPPPV